MIYPNQLTEWTSNIWLADKGRAARVFSSFSLCAHSLWTLGEGFLSFKIFICCEYNRDYSVSPPPTPPIHLKVPVGQFHCSLRCDYDTIPRIKLLQYTHTAAAMLHPCLRTWHHLKKQIFILFFFYWDCSSEFGSSILSELASAPSRDVITVSVTHSIYTEKSSQNCRNSINWSVRLQHLDFCSFFLIRSALPLPLFHPSNALVLLSRRNFSLSAVAVPLPGVFFFFFLLVFT